MAKVSILETEEERLKRRLIQMEQAANLVRNELREVQSAKKVVERLQGGGKGGKAATPAEKPAKADKPEPPRITIKAAALDVLKSVHPLGYEKSAIMDEIKRRHGIEINSGSLSVMLARLRDTQHSLEYDGTAWFFVPPEKRKKQGQ